MELDVRITQEMCCLKIHKQHSKLWKETQNTYYTVVKCIDYNNWIWILIWIGQSYIFFVQCLSKSCELVLYQKWFTIINFDLKAKFQANYNLHIKQVKLPLGSANIWDCSIKSRNVDNMNFIRYTVHPDICTLFLRKAWVPKLSLMKILIYTGTQSLPIS